MKKKRLFVAFIVVFACFQVLLIRLVTLMTNEDYSEVAAGQSRYTTVIKYNRPDFYDCNGKPLTGTEATYKALIIPSESTSLNAVAYLSEQDKETFVERLQRESLPFLIDVDEPLPAYTLIKTVQFDQRYSDAMLARHIIGYVDIDNVGVTGLELALDEYLAEHTIKTTMSIQVNARNQPVNGTEVEFTDSAEDEGGIVLSIDSEIQRIAESVARANMERGAIIIMDVATGEIKAMVSLPDYDPNDIAISIDADDTSLINRCLTAYNLGSVYKPVIAAAALESGFGGNFWHDCEGEIEVDGQIYTCYNNRVHGVVDLRGAIEVSCNTYFIALGEYLGTPTVYNTAVSMGLGKRIELYPGLYSSPGTMPTIEQLGQPGEFINHCFGQGLLMATPLQVATYTNAIANDGLMVDPKLVLSVGGVAVEYEDVSRQVISQQTAEYIAAYMRDVVVSGTGAEAQPAFNTAAGKTGTAQTGIYTDGVEKTIGWYSGFFPYEEPQYTITIMVEGGLGFSSAGPIFKQLIDTIYYTENMNTADE